MNLRTIKSKSAYIIAVSAFFLLTSCEDFLSVEPKQSISDELAIVDKPSLNTALRGAYRSLGSGGYYGGTYVTLGFVPSGNVEYNVFNNLNVLNFLPEDGAFQSAWASIYSTINITNHIIAKVPTIKDVNLTEAERNSMLGEAHFIRALAYFDLARGFGGVPIKLTPTVDLNADGKIARSTLDQTYQQVLEDLNIAEGLISSSLNRIRATRVAVYALKARYYLYREDWENAIEYSTLALSSPDHKLTPTFAGWFKEGVTQTSESILELAFSAQNTNDIRTTMSLQARGGEYRFAPTRDVVVALKNGGGRLALLDSAKQSNTTLYAGALYYRSPATDPSYILRVAEQYLIRAEAKAKLDDPEGALDDLNTIRRRAELDDSDAETKEEILAAILEERRFEFLWEAHRYFDLVRTGTLKEEIQRLKPNLNITDKLNRFPIPTNEVQLAGLAQNPEY